MPSSVMWSSCTDETLLAGLAESDPEAATAFVRRFQARVFGLVLTIVGDRGRAEDVAQEAFVRAWRHAATYDPRRGRVATWLLAIARNVAIDTTRLKSVEPLDPDVVATRLLHAGEAAPPVDHEVPPDERERIRSAIAELPDEQRRPLFLAAYLGRTANEISEMDGVPLGTVKSRIRTAMSKLRDSLEVPDEV
jgi:RNA polymerase sigma factor (sigma-70 family)